MSSQQLDLSQLALERSSAASPPGSVRGRKWITRYVVPGGILFGFFGLLTAAVGARLLPTTPVTVLPVIVARGEAQPAGTALFQAAGWIEPRPTAISVAALAPGVIEELLVVEGQQVECGQPIARLVDIDARQALKRAENALAIRQGELHRAEAELEAARLRLANPLHLQAQVADAKSLLAQAESELAKLPFLIQSAEARLVYAKQNLEGKQAARSAIPGRILQQAESEHLAIQAELNELEQRAPRLQRETAALQAKVDALATQLELLIDESRQVQEAIAKVESATALCDQARLNIETAELMLERTTVRSPIAGRILQVVAAPGTRVMGLEEVAGQSSSTVAEMYDPERLQVRADVRLEDVPLVQPGQHVEIETPSSAESLRGRVLHITSTANIQKNTLEVKVELLDPPAAVRPDMLVTATFLAPESGHSPAERELQESIFIPKQFVRSGDSGASVWVVGANDLAERRSIAVGKATRGELIEVSSGLTVTDKLIAGGFENLNVGERIRVTGEDQMLGRRNR